MSKALGENALKAIKAWVKSQISMGGVCISCRLHLHER